MKHLILFDNTPNDFYADEKFQVIDLESLRFILDTIEWDLYPSTSQLEEEYICPICECDSNVGHSDICVLKNLKGQIQEESSEDRVAYCAQCKKATTLEGMSTTFAGNFCAECSKQLRFQLDYGCTFEEFPTPMSFIHTRADND